MTLYELTDELMQLLELAEDPEVDPEVLEDTLAALTGEIEDKAVGYGKVIRQLESDAVALKAEEARLNNRRKTLENNVKRMKDSLFTTMKILNRQKIDTELFKFSIRKNPAAVVMDEQYIESIPKEYLIPQEPKIDRAKLKEDLKAGKDLDGIAHLEQGESLTIK